jgi:hypothetical protein
VQRHLRQVARRAHARAEWLADLHSLTEECLPEKRKVGGSTPPLPTLLAQHLSRSEPFSGSCGASPPLTAAARLRPRFAAACRTWVARCNALQHVLEPRFSGTLGAQS